MDVSRPLSLSLTYTIAILSINNRNHLHIRCSSALPTIPVPFLEPIFHSQTWKEAIMNPE